LQPWFKLEKPLAEILRGFHVGKQKGDQVQLWSLAGLLTVRVDYDFINSENRGCSSNQTYL